MRNITMQPAHVIQHRQSQLPIEMKRPALFGHREIKAGKLLAPIASTLFPHDPESPLAVSDDRWLPLKRVRLSDRQQSAPIAISPDASVNAVRVTVVAVPSDTHGTIRAYPDLRTPIAAGQTLANKKRLGHGIGGHQARHDIILCFALSLPSQPASVVDRGSRVLAVLPRPRDTPPPNYCTWCLQIFHDDIPLAVVSYSSGRPTG